jgi:hypothetical protein
MKTTCLRSLLAASLWACASVLTAQTTAPEDKLDHVPPLTEAQRAEIKANLARARLGTTIKAVENTSTAQNFESVYNTETQENAPLLALLSDDESIARSIPAGDNTFILSLLTTSLIDSFGFINTGGEGTYSLFYSTRKLEDGDSRWKPVIEKSAYSQNGFSSQSFAPIEAKHVKIIFHAAKAGEIGGLALFGDLTNGGYIPEPKTSRDPVPIMQTVYFDYADAYAGADIVYVSSRAEQSIDEDAPHLSIDDNPNTVYHFAPDDPNPTVIVALSSPAEVRRISAVYNGPPGKLEYYTMSSLNPLLDASAKTGQPQARLQYPLLHPRSLLASLNPSTWLGAIAVGQNFPQIINIPPGYFNNMTPLITTDANGGNGRHAANVDMIPASYLALRFVPQNGPGNGFSLYEVNVFGNTTLGVYHPYYGPIEEGNLPGLNLLPPPTQLGNLPPPKTELPDDEDPPTDSPVSP